MAVVKCTAIHRTPMKLFEYILNPAKNRNGELVTGWNCGCESADVYNSFKIVFEYFSKEKFEQPEEDTKKKSKKERIRVFHYVQSFAEGEISPEKAHKIGVEWAKRVFGWDSMFIVSTHTDTDHIHNHIALCPYRSKGEIWYHDLKTIKKCREQSDRICRKEGLSVIDDPEHRSTVSHAEYVAKKKDNSWKDKLRRELDRIVKLPDTKTIEDLKRILEEEGYTIRHKKYITITAPNCKHGIRSFRLGTEYSLENLIFRIDNKDHILTDDEIMELTGIQKDYAICLRKMQRDIYLYNLPPEVRDKELWDEVRKTSELLCFMSENNIHTERDFEVIVNRHKKNADDLKEQLDDHDDSIKFIEGQIEHFDRFLELYNKPKHTVMERMALSNYQYLIDKKIFSHTMLHVARKEIADLKRERESLAKEYERCNALSNKTDENYKYYLGQMGGHFGTILENERREEEERRQQEKERIEQAKLREQMRQQELQMKAEEERLLREFMEEELRREQRRSRDSGAR